MLSIEKKNNQTQYHGNMLLIWLFDKWLKCFSLQNGAKYMYIKYGYKCLKLY